VTPVFIYGIIQPGFGYVLSFLLMQGRVPTVSAQRFKGKLTLPNRTGWVELLVSALEVEKMIGKFQMGKCLQSV
jgi:hypothetical protein